MAYRAKNPTALYAALSIEDRPMQQSIDTDYQLMLARSVDLVATPMGTRGHARFISGAVVAQSSGMVIRTTDPNGLWIEGLWPDQNANFAMTVPTVTMVAESVQFGLQGYSYDEQSYPVSNNGGILCFTGATAGGVLAECAFVPAQRNLVEVLGGRFWLPPLIKLCIGGTGVNAVFSGTVSATWASPG